MKLHHQIKKIILIPRTRIVHWANVISMLVVIVGIVILGIYSYYQDRTLQKERDRNAQYTIGLTKGRHKKTRNSRAFVYYYYVYQGKVYLEKEYCPSTRSIISEDGRYYVKFSYRDPTNAELLLDYPVPYSVKKSPYGGWRHIPD